MPKTVKDVDRGFRAVRGNMRKARNSPFVRVGIQGTEASKSRGFDQTNVTLALVHEFGSKDGRIPQRSFIRATVDRELRLLTRLLQRAVKGIAADGNVHRHLGIVGERARAEMIRTIDQTIGLRELTPAGIASKVVPSSKPLVDTGQMKNAITWKVFA